MASDREALAERVVQQVAELPDRTSPDDWPEAMLVTSDELKAIVLAALAAPPSAQEDAIDPLQQLLARLQANHGGILTAGVSLAIDTLQGNSHGWLEVGDTQ
jgi:hypothetical protein